MSTKATISYNKDYHLYRDCFDGKINLDLEDVDFMTSYVDKKLGKVTVSLPDSFIQECIKHELQDRMD